MKKILLGTTAIIGAVSFASVAAADAPRVTVGGFIDFQAASVDDDAAAALERDYGFRNDTEIHFNVDGKTDSGLGYGAVIEMEADATDDTTASGTNSDRTYVYVDGGWGRFELGSNSDSASALKVDASTVARATGGIDGDWFRFAAAPAGAYIVRPDLPTQHGGTTTPGETENAAKVNYYTPSMSGFQLGVSFTPDTDAKGQSVSAAGFGGGLGSDYEDVLSGGVHYSGQWDQVGIALSATGETGDDTFGGEDLDAWALGASANFAGFSFAGSWSEIDGSAFGAGSDGEVYTLGGAYDFGAFGVSATWLDSEVDFGGVSDEFQNFSVGADYSMAPGLTPYAEVNFFEYDGAAVGADNEGTIFIVGTQLAF